MQLAEILTAEKAAGHSNLVVLATLVEPSMMRWLDKLGDELEIEHVNVMRPMLAKFNNFLGSQARGVAGTVSQALVMNQLDDLVSREFMGMIEASNFARSRSDSSAPSDWAEADVILVGVSRSGKLGVASFLAHRGKKVACVAISDCEPPPAGLDDADPSKVVLITRSEDAIVKRRRKRLDRMDPKSGIMGAQLGEDYADEGKVQRDLAVFNQLAQQHPNWIGPLDCTYVCEDETTMQILDLQRELRVKSRLRASDPDEESVSPILFALVPVALAVGAFLGQQRALGPAAERPLAPWRSALAAGRRPGCLRRWRIGAANAVVRQSGAQQRIDSERILRRDLDADLAGDGSLANKTIFVISDRSGETAQLVLSRILVQYSDQGQPAVRLFNDVDSPESLRAILLEATNNEQETLVFSTLVKPVLTRKLEEVAAELSVNFLNVMPPLVELVSRVIGTRALVDPVGSNNLEPAGGPLKNRPVVNPAFFRMAEAVEFTQKHISGLNAQEWPNADVLLVGVSRVGKETLAYYLAQRGIKAACVTIGPDSPAPRELASVDPNKVVVVTMSLEFLQKRRESRVKELTRQRLPTLVDAEYADVDRVRSELSFLERLASEHPRWSGPIDLTDYDVTEAADYVMDVIRRRSATD